MNNSIEVVSEEELRNCVEKFIYLDGYKFTLDETTGYYRCSALRKRLHQYVWEKFYGNIEEGHHVHHVDEDKKNNHIDNLVAMCGSEHTAWHGKNRTEEQRENAIENLVANARPKASEWHGSPEGIEFHKAQYRKYEHKLREKVNLKCDQCEVEFKNINRTRFCSNKCKSKWRRVQGVDNVERACKICEVVFTVNKYEKTLACSRACGYKLRLNK